MEKRLATFNKFKLCFKITQSTQLAHYLIRAVSIVFVIINIVTNVSRIPRNVIKIKSNHLFMFFIVKGLFSEKQIKYIKNNINMYCVGVFRAISQIRFGCALSFLNFGLFEWAVKNVKICSHHFERNYPRLGRKEGKNNCKVVFWLFVRRNYCMLNLYTMYMRSTKIFRRNCIWDNETDQTPK